MYSFFRKFSIIDYLNLLCLAVIVVFYLLAFDKTPYKILAPLAFLALFILLVLMVYLRDKNIFGSAQPLISVIYPAIFVLGIFESFFMVLSYFNSSRYDGLMAAVDRWLLGVDPTVWFESWVHPLSTDLFYLLYIVYFPLPFFILVWLFRKRKLKELGEAIFIYVATYFGAYIIYFFVPVQGPRFFLAHLQTVPLDGIIFAEPIRNLVNFCEPNKLDAFPSLHTTIVLTTLILCYRHNRKMFRVFVPLSVGILISLVYCRYHYFIDMVAGAVWTFAAYFTALFLYKKFNPKCYPHFGNRKDLIKGK